MATQVTCARLPAKPYVLLSTYDHIEDAHLSLSPILIIVQSFTSALLLLHHVNHRQYSFSRFYAPAKIFLHQSNFRASSTLHERLIFDPSRADPRRVPSPNTSQCTTWRVTTAMELWRFLREGGGFQCACVRKTAEQLPTW